jgi:hypothetical protein
MAQQFPAKPIPHLLLMTQQQWQPVTGEETRLTGLGKISSLIFCCDKDKIASLTPPWEMLAIKF